MKRSLTSINIFVYTVKQEGGFFWCPDNTQPAMMDDRIPKEVPTRITHLRPSFQYFYEMFICFTSADLTWEAFLQL